MHKIKVEGGVPLIGNISISGAKNAGLPLMAASLLTDKKLILSNLPHLSDISTMANLLIQHGVDFCLDGKDNCGGHYGKVIALDASKITSFEAPYDIVKKMRASVLVLGPLLARFGEAKVSLPGGCAIGTRPIDLHLKAFEAMGAQIDLDHGYISATAKNGLTGAIINFDKVSVGATENVLMAATLAKGQTILTNSAKEPEITDLANCLNSMGAKIKGIGTDRLVIDGVTKLHGANHNVVCDRIEAGTYMIAAAITGGNINLYDIQPDLLESTIIKLQECGVKIKINKDHINVSSNLKDIKAINASTQPYPGFPTDMQAQLMSLLAIAKGTSVVSENIFENRFMHVPELCRMGANISISGHDAVIKGIDKFNGAELLATDLRASVSLVLAALAADGTSIISRMYHIDRGYERIEEKLSYCGAKIVRLN